MHMNQILAACPLVQIVDVLRDQEEFPAEFMLELRQRRMSGIGRYLRRQQLSSALVIEFVHQLWISRKTFQRCDIIDVMIGPQTLCSPKGFYA